MRIDRVYIKKFKNLNNFSINIDENEWHTVLLGQNAAGKSNFLEALVIIFRDLDLEQQTSFSYSIEYKCNGNLIKVNGGPDVENKFGLFLGEKTANEIKYSTIVSKAEVKRNKGKYLPRYVFSYYSGVSNRLLEHFDVHQRRFYEELIKSDNIPAQRPLFYARLIHSYFVLMAFYSFSDSKVSKFMEDYLGIVGLESMLFVFKRPIWDKKNKDPLDFWGAKGVVRNFLSELWDAAMAPIVYEDKVRLDFRRDQKQDHLYLYISNQDKLQKIARKYGNNAGFFKSLESTYISDLIQEVRIKVRKRNVNGDITFKELSEGEQQLLTVLGLLRFTKEDESLILLDEPDTHLNPLWKWRYMSLLHEIVRESKPKDEETSQILMTTHDPLVIGGLTKEEIRIFQSVKSLDEKGDEYQKVEAFQPDFDPKGLGVAGILTSGLFGLPSTLDKETFDLLNRRNDLIVKQDSGVLTIEEKKELNDIFITLSAIGINTTDRDPLFEKFLIAMSKIEAIEPLKTNKDDLLKQNEVAKRILETLIKGEKK
ncbi:AAA family ATPase [Mucilaginibacter sp. KACC 22773]|uniref:AAA family ATPase n=1 Tax=Mucilaginibacter sp. KACC 22773 TaxID=3025671 RepID=UPI002365A9BD|nr:ATP-binding protein [Mucilaginibacter sp. KACC 22773]WDF77712.1 AAA family ATPase [Mucilaginibacter sp. KACC 22773]